MDKKAVDRKSRICYLLPMIESRREKRIPHTVSLRYSVYGDSERNKYQCISVDVSTSGLGIVSETPLEFGQFVAFESEMSTVSPVDAIVQWCAPLDGKQYRAGLYLF